MVLGKLYNYTSLTQALCLRPTISINYPGNSTTVFFLLQMHVFKEAKVNQRKLTNLQQNYCIPRKYLLYQLR